MKKSKLIIATLMLIIITVSTPMQGFAKELDSIITDDPRILFLLSYSYDWESVPLQLDGVAEAVDGYANVDYVFMDTKRQGYDDVKGHIYDQIMTYEEMNGAYDYILAGDDAALHFVLEYQNDLFKNIPIVFEGINDVAFAKEAAKDPLITGIVEKFPIQDTIQLALDINKKAKKVVAISDDTISGKGSTEQFLACKTAFPDMKFEVMDTSNLTADEIAKQVSSYGDDTILLFLMLSNSIGDAYYSNTETTEFIAANSNIPVYKADEIGIGNGILGGVVLSYKDMASDAVQMIMNVESGQDFASFDMETATTYCKFDKDVMNRFAIKKSQLPKDSVYINDPESFLERNRQMIPPFILVCLLTITICVVAYWNRKRHLQIIQLEKQSKKEIQKIQKSMETAIDGADVTYFEYYPEQKMAYEYNGLSRFGTSKQMDNYPQSWFDLHVTIPEDEKTLWDAFRKVEDGTSDAVCEVRSKVDNQILWFRYTFTQIKEPENQEIKVGCIAQNINDLKVAETILKNEKDKLRKVINSIAVGVYVCEIFEEHYRVIFANAAFCKMLGHSHEMIVGKQDEQALLFVHPDDAHILQEMAKEMHEAGNEVSYEYRAKNADTGEYQWLLACGRSVRQDGRLLAYTSVLDITKEKRSQELEIELELEKKANRTKTEFLSNMSHEIRTPMNAIIGMTKLAEDEVAPDSQVKRYLEEIDASSLYLLDVINDILDMSRIENGKMELNKKWVSPTNVLKTCINMMIPLLEKKHISLHCPDLQKKKINYEYFVDEQKIKQILMNLLNNAYKFTSDGGSITICAKNISVDQENHTVVDQFIVEDTGCGMSKEFLPTVFEPFSQERISNVGAIQGTGLGLSLAKHFAELMGGTISVESEIGNGSKFTVTIPYEYRQASNTIEEKHEEKSFQHLRGKRILIAEDHPLNATIVMKLLEKQGVLTVHAHDGVEAVQLFKKSDVEWYDAILMDIRMPNMDGLAATKKIRGLDRIDAKTIPIIALTANAFDDDRDETQEAGMNAHLSKPIEPQELYQNLNDCILNK